jgi:hypothetical protein
LKIVLSTYLQLTPSSLTTVELEHAAISSTDWYYLNLLAESSDFRILLKNNQLTSEFLNPTNLKRLYGTQRKTATI